MVLAAVLLWMGVLSCYDVCQRRLPNALTLPGAAVILLGGYIAGHGVAALAGAGALAGVYLLVHLAAPGALGAGDVKLAVGLGAVTGCCGVDVWLLAALAAAVLTAVWGVVARICRRAASVPHGLSMCAATAAGMLLALPR